VTASGGAVLTSCMAAPGGAEGNALTATALRTGPVGPTLVRLSSGTIYIIAGPE
jgi:hypothetical protein